MPTPNSAGEGKCDSCKITECRTGKFDNVTVKCLCDCHKAPPEQGWMDEFHGLFPDKDGRYLPHDQETAIVELIRRVESRARKEERERAVGEVRKLEPISLEKLNKAADITFKAPFHQMAIVHALQGVQKKAIEAAAQAVERGADGK